LLYALATWILGFTPNRHEGKLVGLAAYGQVDREFLRWLLHEKMPPAGPQLIVRDPLDPFVLRRFLRRCGRENFVATLQEAVEHRISDWVRAHTVRRRVHKICVAGGVFANVKANQRLADLESVEDVFVLPPMGDSGLSVGGPLLLRLLQGQVLPSIDSMYLGPTAGPREPEVTDPVCHLTYGGKDLAQWLAEQILAGAIVGVVASRMEFGPRALGHRSILASAHDRSMPRKLNNRLSRSDFMPFAPIVLEEDATILFPRMRKCRGATRYMTITLPFADRFRHDFPAVTHVDGTARPQVLRKQDDDLLWSLLKHIKTRRGFGIALNTSLNMHEDPIACSVEDAMALLRSGALDLLVVGDRCYGR
jgi:carbamoyltransferase